MPTAQRNQFKTLEKTFIHILQFQDEFSEKPITLHVCINQINSDKDNLKRVFEYDELESAFPKISQCGIREIQRHPNTYMIVCSYKFCYKTLCIENEIGREI